MFNIRRFLLIVIITFSFNSLSEADDIKDFEIDGMSIGDSLLKYYDKKKIINALNDAYYYPDKKFLDIFIKPSNISSYEWLQITLKKSEKKFLAHAIAGQVDFTNNINECYKKKSDIAKEVQQFFDNRIKPKTVKIIHPIDKSGKSKIETTEFQLNGGRIEIQCFDWSSNVSYSDKLIVNVKSTEAIDYFSNVYN